MIPAHNKLPKRANTLLGRLLQAPRAFSWYYRQLRIFGDPVECFLSSVQLTIAGLK